MKITAKWELTTVVNKEMQRKKRSIDRIAFLRIVRETEKYPLLVRVASELYRAGVTPGVFIETLHKDDWSMSTRVMEELERIDKGRCGYDPDRVPPILPVYLKPLTNAAKAEKKAIKGRPKREFAQKETLRWVKHVLSLGWTEGDVQRGIDDVLGDNEPVIHVKADPDLVAALPAKAKTHFKYYVHDGSDDWLIFKSPAKAKEAIDALRTKVMQHIRDADPMPDMIARICAECKKPLNGQVMTIREDGPPTKKGRKPSKKVIEHLHPNCYWLKRVEPVRVPLNMQLLNPADGKLYTWHGADKGGWSLKGINENTKVEEAPVSSVGENGVSREGSSIPSTAVPVAQPA